MFSVSFPTGLGEGLGWVFVISCPQGLVHGMCPLSACTDVNLWVHREGAGVLEGNHTWGLVFPLGWPWAGLSLPEE